MKNVSTYGTRFRDVIEVLKKENVIEVPKVYRPGLSSMTYRLGSGFDEFTTVKVTLSRRKRKTSTQFSDKNHQWIYDSVVRTRLSLKNVGNVPRSIRTISKELESGEVRLKTSGMYRKLKSVFLHRNVTERERVFHQVSEIPKEYRKQLIIDGKRTVEIDISSSNFVLLSGILRSENVNSQLPLDDWLERGKFYEEISKRVWGNKVDREIVKRLCMKFLDSKKGSRLGPTFDDLKKIDPTVTEKFKELRTFFQTQEPELFKFVEEQNHLRRPLPVGPGFQSVGGLLYRLMMKEVEVVIEGIVGWCREQGVPVISIHDGVIVKQSDFRRFGLKKKFETIIRNRTGVRPFLKVVHGV